VPAPIPSLSHDGYIRMRLAHLNTLSFVHLYSESDAGFLYELHNQTVPARAAGFSEWTSDSTPAVSIGWAWFIDQASDRMLLAPEDVRSNLMLIDLHGYDLGPRMTATLLFAWLSGFDWQSEVSAAVHDTLSSC